MSPREPAKKRLFAEGKETETVEAAKTIPKPEGFLMPYEDR